MRPTSLASLAALSFAAARAFAEPPPAPAGLTPARAHLTAKLDFSLAEGVSQCPREAVLHEEVARRLGYDPFAPNAQGAPFGVVRVVVARKGSGLSATYERRDPQGVLAWSRAYEVPGADRESCDLVITALGAFLAIELSSFARAAPPPSSSPSPAAPPIAPPSVADAAPSSPPARISKPPIKPPSRGRFEIGAGAFVGFGAGPGGAVHAGLAVADIGDEGRMLVAVEGRIHAPRVDLEGVRAQLFVGSIVVCYNRDVASRGGVVWGGIVCAIGAAGAIRGAWQSDEERASLARLSPYAAVGGRLGWEARFAPFFAVRVEADVTPALSATAIVLPGRARASGMSSVMGSAGISVVLMP